MSYTKLLDETMAENQNTMEVSQNMCWTILV